MKTVNITVSDEFNVPDLIYNLKPNEWETILISLNNILINRDEINVNEISNNIINNNIKKYEEIINRINIEKNKLFIEIKNVNEENSNIKLEYENKISNEIENLTNKLITEHEKEKNNLINLYEEKIKLKDTELDGKTDIINKKDEVYNNMISFNNKTYDNIIAGLNNDNNKLIDELNSIKIENSNVKNEYDKKYENIINTLNNEKNTLLEEIKTIRLEHVNVKTNYETKYITEMSRYKELVNERLTAEYNKEKVNMVNLYEDRLKLKDEELTNKLTMMNNKDTLYNETINKYNDIIENYKKDIENYKKDIEASKKDIENNNNVINTINSLSESLKPVYKFYNGTNMEKGNLGEKRVFNLLTQNSYFKDAIIEDTSNQTSRGDIYLKWKGLRCLLEIKNKDYVTKEDISKFKKDVLLTSDSIYNINSAILISLKTDQFYGQSRENIKLELINNVPHLYIYLKNNDDIEYALSYLEFIINNKIDNTEKNAILINYFKSYYALVTNSIKIYENRILSYEKEIKKLYKEYHTYKDNLKNIEPNLFLIGKKASIDEDENSESKTKKNKNEDNEDNESNSNIDEDENKKEKTVLHDEEYYIREKIKKTYINSIAKDEEISEEIFAKIYNVTDFDRFGSYQKMMEEAKSDFLKKWITDEIVTKISEYKIKNGGYPERSYVTKQKILRDHVIRKVGKIFCIPNAYNFICNYVSTRAINTQQ